MAHGSANINSPDIIREFRGHFVSFDNVCRNALMGVEADVRGTVDWLRGEQHLYWKTMVRKCEEAMQSALGELRRAQQKTTRDIKKGTVDEQRAYEKAKRRKEEAEAKIASVKRWTMLLEQKAEKLLTPCRMLGAQLDTATPKAVARLDKMLINLEEYLRTSPEEE